MNYDLTWHELSPSFQIESMGLIQSCNYHPAREGHSYWILVLMNKGKRTLYANDKELRIGPHDFFLLPPYTKQAPWEEDEHTACFVHFYTDGKEVPAPECVDTSKLYLPVFGRLPDTPDCFSLLRYLCDYSLSPYADTDFLVMQLHALFAMLSLHCQTHPKAVGQKDFFCDLCLSYIKEHACVPLQAQDYEDAFGLSYHRINQKFKANFGLTVKQYHKRLRMNHAAQMLQSGMSLQQTAQYCGYEDYYFFISSFKQEFGVSPSTYRHMHGIKREP